MPENDPAEVVGRRIGAALLDLVVLLVLLVIVGLVFGQGHTGGGQVAVRLHGVSAVVWTILVVSYFLFPETLNGQTLGKRLLGVRVVSTGGGKPSAGAVVTRTLLRVIDFLPFLYLLGLLVILASRGRGQRLGDLAARTTIVGAR